MLIVRSDLLVLLNQDSHSIAIHYTVTIIDTKILNSPNEAPMADPKLLCLPYFFIHAALPSLLCGLGS
jgi:hypothetical protein